MFLKQLVKDLFDSNAADYWKDEGCNIRMRRYVLISKILRVLQLLLMLFLMLYFIFISTISIVNLNNLDRISDLTRFIVNVYEITFIGIIGLNVIDYRIKKYSLDKLSLNIIKSLVVLPLIALIMFYFDLIGNLMISFWFLVLFMAIDFAIKEFNKRIKYLYEICIGKERIKND